MKVLLLGGTADARRLADALHKEGRHQTGLQVIYSLAGLVRIPKVDCQLVVGGFTQFGGLATYLRDNDIGSVLDVTHPYAQTMSQKAVDAAREVGIPCWRFHRPAWEKEAQDNWTEYQTDEDVLAQFSHYRVPLLSAGQMSEDLLTTMTQLPNIEHMVWRTAVEPTFSLPDKIHWIKAIGPFFLDDERQLLMEQGIDVIVSKNSGGKATYAKLEAARALSIPVLLQRRPVLPVADREFSDLETCLQACLAAWGSASLRQRQQKDSQQ
ncbi:precorrin-6A/cobalt-precorrin-6A reductase [Marinomonas sp. IMCC 4694]|uniref:precorrin-6A/cobalt-precorrin-6A reductase n=1 Tax=Marinomonas sp. IMCC 4694 TaxID=2605432 RepID=UPI0011E6B0E5|nr:precorrin-6A/cobalt-precorrin-6A reductase [Marinomonas sp. IMCC 4694]TYL47343.1 cobalt-precorrin-6A reductase [Marinomonas sp. IMCC 4694]